MGSLKFGLKKKILPGKLPCNNIRQSLLLHLYFELHWGWHGICQNRLCWYAWGLKITKGEIEHCSQWTFQWSLVSCFIKIKPILFQNFNFISLKILWCCSNHNSLKLQYYTSWVFFLEIIKLFFSLKLSSCMLSYYEKRQYVSEIIFWFKGVCLCCIWSCIYAIELFQFMNQFIMLPCLKRITLISDGLKNYKYSTKNSQKSFI